MRWSGVLAVALLATAAVPTAAQPVQININTTSTLGKFTYGRVSSVGWYWTPTTSFFLSAIHTKFNSTVGANVDRTVSVELWSNRPAVGGSLLASANFQSNQALGTLGGGAFAPFLVQAGMQYFIGFRNVQGLGVNYTNDPLALAMGPLYYSNGPVYTDDKYNLGSDPTRKPVLEIIGRNAAITPVPEPATMGLLAIGLVALGGAQVLRRRKMR